MATFQIWHMGSNECSIEDASSERDACEKLGWDSQECRVQRIPDEIIFCARQKRQGEIRRLAA